MLAAYAGLAANSSLRTDDFLLAALDRSLGRAMVLHRLATWSPRPVSEALFTFYVSCVVRLGRPLIEPTLWLLWLVTFAMPLTAALRLARGNTTALPLALTFILATLVLSDPGEMFYWPAGALAYLPSTCAIATIVLWQTLNGSVTPRSTIAHALLLLVAAGSSELGALVVLLYAGAQSLQAVLRGTLVSPRAQLWWLIPALLAAAVLASAGLGRLSTNLVLTPGTRYPASWLLSLLAATGVLGNETLGLAGNGIALETSPAALAVGLAVKSLLCLGFVWTCPRAPRAAPGLLLAGALLATAYASAALALHSFGELCCGRQATMRQALILLALLAVAPSLAPVRPRPRAALTALLAAALIGFAYRLPSLRHDYDQRAAVLAAHAATWQSGRQPGPAMTFHNPPLNLIADTEMLPPGRCSLGTPYQACQSVLLFFQKQTMLIAPSDR